MSNGLPLVGPLLSGLLGAARAACSAASNNSGDASQAVDMDALMGTTGQFGEHSTEDVGLPAPTVIQNGGQGGGSGCGQTCPTPPPPPTQNPCPPPCTEHGGNGHGHGHGGGGGGDAKHGHDISLVSSGNNGILNGTQIYAPIQIPIDISGIAVGVLGSAAAGSQGGASAHM